MKLFIVTEQALYDLANSASAYGSESMKLDLNSGLTEEYLSIAKNFEQKLEACRAEEVSVEEGLFGTKVYKPFSRTNEPALEIILAAAAKAAARGGIEHPMTFCKDGQWYRTDVNGVPEAFDPE